MITEIMYDAIQHYVKNPNTQTIPIYSLEKNLPVQRVGSGSWTTAYRYDDGKGVPTILLSVRKTGSRPDKTKDLLVKLNKSGFRPHIPIIEKLDKFTKAHGDKDGEPRVLYRMPLYKVYEGNDVTDILVEARDDVRLTYEETEGKELPEIGRIYRRKYLDHLKTFIDPKNKLLKQLPSVIEDLEDLNDLADKDRNTAYFWDFGYQNLALDNEGKVILLDVMMNKKY